jgi:hypothetical protein
MMTLALGFRHHAILAIPNTCAATCTLRRFVGSIPLHTRNNRQIRGSFACFINNCYQAFRRTPLWRGEDIEVCAPIESPLNLVPDGSTMGCFPDSVVCNFNWSTPRLSLKKTTTESSASYFNVADRP